MVRGKEGHAVWDRHGASQRAHWPHSCGSVTHSCGSVCHSVCTDVVVVWAHFMEY